MEELGFCQKLPWGQGSCSPAEALVHSQCIVVSKKVTATGSGASPEGQTLSYLCLDSGLLPILNLFIENLQPRFSPRILLPLWEKGLEDAFLSFILITTPSPTLFLFLGPQEWAFCWGFPFQWNYSSRAGQEFLIQWYFQEEYGAGGRWHLLQLSLLLAITAVKGLVATILTWLSSYSDT